MVRRVYTRSNKKSKQHEESPSKPVKLDSNLNTNIQQLKKLLDAPNDLVVREIKFEEANITSAIVYISGLIDRQLVQDSILVNLQNVSQNLQYPIENVGLFHKIYQSFISITSIELGNTLDDVTNGILSGKTVLFLDNTETVLLMDTKGGESRGIEAPTTETVVRGPKTAFVENLGTNLSLLRRSLQSPDLRFKTHQIGRRSKRSLVVAYVDGVINPAIVGEVNRRIETIDIDDAPEAGFIEQWIEDSFLSPFPQMNNTERMDRAASALLQGKVVILLDGTPFVLIAPVTLGDILKSPEDYYERWLIGSLLRFLRYLAAFMALFLPGLYFISNHPSRNATN